MKPPRNSRINFLAPIKKPRENSEARRHTLSREERQLLQVSAGHLTFGLAPHSQRLPITVAGPWPIFTAFPLPKPVQLSNASVCRARNSVNLRARVVSESQFQQAQRFFHFGARFSTSARKPSC